MQNNNFTPTSTVVAAFTAPDTVCVNAPVNIKNISSGVTTSFWNFCVSSLNTIPEGENLGNVYGAFSLPVFSDFVVDNGNYYVFVVNNYPGGLVRLDFGSSMLNSPTAVSLGNFGGKIPNNAEGIQLVHVNGKWIAIIVGGYPAGGVPSRILKVDFGTTVSNTSPIVTDWGNIGNMNYPIDLHVFQENNRWFGFTLNSENQTLTRFDFGTDFSSPPTAINLGNIGNFSGPTGIFAINDNGFWRVFITNSVYGTKFTRLDFGSSLLNTPTVVDLGNVDNLFIRPRDIIIMKICDETVGFVVDSSGIEKLTFANGLDQPPHAQMIGNIGNMDFPHSISKIFRVGADLFCFVTNVSNNSITRIRFNGCSGVTIPNSTQFNPPVISYPKAGTYNINLLVDDGLPTQTSFCKTIVVVDKAIVQLGGDTTICEASSLKLQPILENVKNVIWSDGSSSPSITVKNPGKYWVKSNDISGCNAADTINVAVQLLPKFSLGNDTTICDHGQVVLKSPVAGDAYNWNTGNNSSSIVVTSSGLYSLNLIKSGCSFSDTIQVISAPMDYVNLGNDTVICGAGTLQLQYQPRVDESVLWSTGSNASSIVVQDPGLYWIQVSNSAGCYRRDTIALKSASIPVFSLGPDTIKCVGQDLNISSPVTADYYKWNTGALSKNLIIKSAGLYSLYIRKNGCEYSDTMNVVEKPAPVFDLGVDTAICKNQTIEFDFSQISGDFSWNDGSQTPDKIISVPGVYTLTITSGGCATSDQVKVYEKKPPLISLGNDFGICIGQPVTISPVVEGGSFNNWEDGYSNQVRIVNQPGRYIASAINVCGISYDTLEIKSGGNVETASKIPNAFSPNGDGRNDCFGVSKLGLIEITEFSIFNRFGQKVFSTTNALNCWDGTFAGKRQPEGAYAYILRGKSYCGDIDKKGLILLLR